MRKLNIIIMVISILLVIFLIGVMVVVATRDKSQLAGWFNSGEDYGEMVLVNEQTASIDDIEKIRLLFTSHEIEVKSTDEPEIRICHYANKEISSDQFLTVNASGRTLEVRAPKYRNFGISLFGWISGYARQRFEVYIPSAYSHDFQIELTSGDLVVSDLSVEQFVLNMTSGYARLSHLSSTEMDVEITSGDATLQDVLVSGALYTKLTSGGMKGTNISADSLTYRMTSGDYSLQGSLGALDLEMSSGAMNIETDIVPTALTMRGTSGDCRITMPENDGFTLNFYKTSGDFRSDFDLSDYRSDDKQGTFHYKDGGNQYSIDITSGTVSLRKSENASNNSAALTPSSTTSPESAGASRNR